MKPIPGFPGYQITTDGRVWSEPRRRTKGGWLKPWVSHGYMCVVLFNRGRIHKLVHRLVLETYVGPCPPRMECRHLNGNPKDNRLENLCWGTSSENTQDAMQHGTHRCTKQNGEKHHNSKLTEQKVKLIYNLYHSGADTQQGLADAFGVTDTCIWEIINKRTWKHLWG